MSTLGPAAFIGTGRRGHGCGGPGATGAGVPGVGGEEGEEKGRKGGGREERRQEGDVSTLV